MYIPLIRDIYEKTRTLHHAFLIQGPPAEVEQELITFIESDLDIVVKGNPDVYIETFDGFSIDDGRLLKTRALRKPLAQKKLFIISFNTMTLEAQNALLKLFEEPTKDTHFFLVTPHTDTLLATLKSRLFCIEEKADVVTAIAVRANTFLRALPKDRISSIKDFVDGKDRVGTRTFFDALESVLYGAYKKSFDIHYIKGLSNLAHAKEYVLNRGSSLKLLLEHVALTLPKIK